MTADDAMSSAAATDCVFFDLDDTLYDQVRPFSLAYRQTFGDAATLDAVSLFIARGRHSDEVFARTQTGELPLEYMYVYRLKAAFADFGVSVTDDECLAMQGHYEQNQKSLALTPTMEGVLDLCHERSRAGVISNGPDGHQREKARALGLERWIPDELMVVSGSVGVMKPDPRIFRLAASRAQSVPRRCLYVGDSFASDVCGACSAGMPVIWFNRRGNPAPSNPTPPDCATTGTRAVNAPTPTHVVATEEELLALLERIL